MPYHTINACSKRPSLLCIITLVLYLGLVGLHFAYIFPAIISGKITDLPIIYIMLGLHFILLIAVIYDYIWILVHDPVDTVVHDPQLAQKIDPLRLTFCNVCGHRLLGSHHCRDCGRCTQQFDHHCKYLNNCIGSKNYEKFLRLLIMNVFFQINLIGQAVWVFVSAHNRTQIRDLIPNTYWVIVGIMSLSVIILIIICVLMGFHCYLSCCFGMTTLDYLFGPKPPQTRIVEKRQQAPLQSQRELR